MSKAQVPITNASVETRYTMTNPSDYYRFVDVAAGETFTINVTRKGVEFNPSTVVMTVLKDTENVDFVAGK